MPRLIFKCPYIKGGTSSATAHLENYVKYMATRNGVERIDPGRSEWPATSKQKKMVEQILRDFPLSRGMFEYEDYAAEPTRTNASEFITRALEDNYNQIAKKDNYLKYIATRPRAQRVGSHGLFTGEEDQLVLAQVAEAVAAHPGNVWLPIISLSFFPYQQPFLLPPLPALFSQKNALSGLSIKNRPKAIQIKGKHLSFFSISSPLISICHFLHS